MFSMDEKKQEVHDSISKAFENPAAAEVAMHRLNLQDRSQLDAKVDAISQDLQRDMGLNNALDAIWKAGKVKMEDPQEAYNKTVATFDKGMEKDVPDDKLRHLLAEEAANKYIEGVTKKNPEHHEALKALLDEEIPRKVNDGVDDFKANLASELEKKMPKPMADAIAESINNKITMDPDALREPMTAAMKNALEKPGYLSEPPEQQRAEVRAAVLAEITKDDTFAKIMPGEKIAHDGLDKVSGLLEQVGFKVPDEVSNAAKGAFDNTAKTVVASLIADKAADKAVPGAAKGSGMEMLSAAHEGIESVTHGLSGILGGLGQAGGRGIAG